MDEIIRCFNLVDFHQSQMAQSLSTIHQELQKLETRPELSEKDFDSVNVHKSQFFSHVNESNPLFEHLKAKRTSLYDQIHKISRATQEWQRADEYHQYILSRSEKIDEKEVQIMQEGKEADEKLKALQHKEQ